MHGHLFSISLSISTATGSVPGKTWKVLVLPSLRGRCGDLIPCLRAPPDQETQNLVAGVGGGCDGASGRVALPQGKGVDPPGPSDYSRPPVAREGRAGPSRGAAAAGGRAEVVAIAWLCQTHPSTPDPAGRGASLPTLPPVCGPCWADGWWVLSPWGPQRKAHPSRLGPRSDKAGLRAGIQWVSPQRPRPRLPPTPGAWGASISGRAHPPRTSPRTFRFSQTPSAQCPGWPQPVTLSSLCPHSPVGKKAGALLTCISRPGGL